MALSFAMMGLLAAQGAPPASQTPAPAVPQEPEITIVGCLAQPAAATDPYTVTVAPAAADAAAAGPADAQAADAARTAAGNARPDAARAAARPAAAAAPATYRIVGLAADQLKPHANHQVELKGHINAPIAASAAAQTGAAKEFRASSVKMLNATCPAAK
jgi:hypothetical protein